MNDHLGKYINGYFPFFFPYEKLGTCFFHRCFGNRFNLLENDPVPEAGSLMTVFFAALMGYTFSLMGRVCHVTGRISTRVVRSSFETTTWGIPRNTLIGGLKQSEQSTGYIHIYI